ncbi:MAG TPA: hypothetical protein PLR28_03855 [Dokdonella sp.]|nr:hypothetical protein [Dokdonella sp.]
MAKATIQNMLDEGFRPEQFGFQGSATSGWNNAGGYLDLVVSEAGLWAADKVGTSVYAAVADPSYALNCLRRAEIEFGRATLFKRRVAFFDSAAHIGLQSPLYAERRGYAADAERAMECAWYFIAEAQRALGIDPSSTMAGTGASLGVVETGRFPACAGQ